MVIIIVIIYCIAGSVLAAILYEIGLHVALVWPFGMVYGYILFFILNNSTPKKFPTPKWIKAIWEHIWPVRKLRIIDCGSTIIERTSYEFHRRLANNILNYYGSDGFGETSEQSVILSKMDEIINASDWKDIKENALRDLFDYGKCQIHEPYFHHPYPSDL